VKEYRRKYLNNKPHILYSLMKRESPLSPAGENESRRRNVKKKSHLNKQHHAYSSLMGEFSVHCK
jgi:hypothetical protein